jgi:translation elongation factor EF-Tu-like GTPase
MNWADKVALTTAIIASIVLIAALRFAIRLGGWG